MADETENRPRSLSVYDYSDKSVRHAWIAVLAYLGLRGFGAVIGVLQQPALALWFAIDLAILAVVLGLLAFGIHKNSRVAVVLALVYVIGTQLYVWAVVRSFSGTLVSIVVTGFLLRGAKRIFEEHRERRQVATSNAAKA